MQLSKLHFIISILNRTRAQTITQQQQNIISSTDFTNFTEVLIEEIFLIIREAPFHHNQTTTRDNTSQAFHSHQHIAQQYTHIDSKVIHTLLSLFQQHVTEHFPDKIFSNPINLLQHLVDQHYTNQHQAITQNPLTGFMNIATSKEIHHHIHSPAGRPYQLFHFFFNRRNNH